MTVTDKSKKTAPKQAAPKQAAPRQNRYSAIIENIFLGHFKPGMTGFTFAREEIVTVARKLKIALPKNLGDVIYSFRYRAAFPASILDKAPKGLEWVIRPSGKALYTFAAVSEPRITPSVLLGETKIPDATPGIIAAYALTDEQALLARVRYNRLIDIFTGVVCYSLQSHLRTTVKGMGQVETDEIYVGVDRRGAQYVFPVQAKGGSDSLGIVQIEQDFALCAAKFPGLICTPVAAQFMADNVIAMFAFEMTGDGVRAVSEKHYRLVAPDQVSAQDLAAYRKRVD